MQSKALFPVVKFTRVFVSTPKWRSFWVKSFYVTNMTRLGARWQESFEIETLDGDLELTRAQSKSTASSMSSWWPILDTPKSSSSWWVIRNSWSPPTFSLSKVLMYCWRQSSRPREPHSETWFIWISHVCDVFCTLPPLNMGWTGQTLWLPFVALQKKVWQSRPHLQPWHAF